MWAAVERLIEDPALRHRLGLAAREELEVQNYTWAGNAARVIGWAEHDLNGKQARQEAPPPAAAASTEAAADSPQTTAI
jgi:hypothetical protein